MIHFIGTKFNMSVCAEALAGPLTWSDDVEPAIEAAELIRSIQTFCLRAVAMRDIDGTGRIP